jgi:hypothetical protein
MDEAALAAFKIRVMRVASREKIRYINREPLCNQLMERTVNAVEIEEAVSKLVEESKPVNCQGLLVGSFASCVRRAVSCQGILDNSKMHNPGRIQER